MEATEGHLKLPSKWTNHRQSVRMIRHTEQWSLKASDDQQICISPDFEKAAATMMQPVLKQVFIKRSNGSKLTVSMKDQHFEALQKAQSPVSQLVSLAGGKFFRHCLLDLSVCHAVEHSSLDLIQHLGTAPRQHFHTHTMCTMQCSCSTSSVYKQGDHMID